MSKKPPKDSPVTFTFIFIVTVFLIISVTILLVWLLSRILIASDVFMGRHLPPSVNIAIFAVLCVIIGTILSFVFSRVIIRPMDELLMALNMVIQGNYDAKVKPHGIKKLKRFGKRFNHMTEELKSISDLNEDFVSNFSHEIKTPITSIHGFAKMIRTEDISEEKRNEYLDIIINESEKLAQFSGNALLFSKIDNWQYAGETAEFDLTEQIRETVVLLENKWSKKNIAFDLEGAEYTIDANRELLSHVWINLIDNAVKFTPENGEIKITLTQEKDTLTVVVADNGIGMDEQIQKNIFNKFYQGDKSHSTVGNGLGLSVAKKIVNLHGGEITVESAPGKGTAITVTLPVSGERLS